MLRINRWRAVVLSVTLALSVLAGRSGADDKEKDEAAQENKTEQGQNEGQQAEESPVPVVNVDLGMDPKDVVAEYEGGKLTAEQFKDYLEIQAFINPQAGLAIQQKDPQALKTFVESYVSEAVMASRAPEGKDTEKSAKELVDRIKGQYLMVFGNDEKKLESHMKEQGVTDKDLTDFFVRYKQVESYLRKNITDEELKKTYGEGERQNAFTIASVRHILISFGENAPTEEGKKRTDEAAKKLAQEMTDRLRKGEDFAKLATEYTDDGGSKETGGLYENVDVSQWVPEFKQAAITLPLNQISDPVKTDYGYHVMKVEKRSEKAFADVKEELRANMINAKYDEFLTNELKNVLKKVNLPEQKK